MNNPEKNPGRVVNPELMLKAARLARPDFKWKIDELMGLDRMFTVVVSRKRSFIGELEAVDERYFDPMDDDSDAWALERALKQRGNGWWSFFVNALGLYMASSAEGPCESQYDDSDTLLLLKCVSAMTGLPLYKTGREG